MPGRISMSATGSSWMACTIFPSVPNSRGLNYLVGGWQLSTAVILQSNTPFSPVLPTDVSGTGGFSDRPNQISDPNVGAPHTPQQWFNKAAFQQQAAGTLRKRRPQHD